MMNCGVTAPQRGAGVGREGRAEAVIAARVTCAKTLASAAAEYSCQAKRRVMLASVWQSASISHRARTEHCSKQLPRCDEDRRHRSTPDCTYV